MEVEEVLSRPIEDRPGREGSQVAIGQTRAGRYLRVIYVTDPIPDFSVYHHCLSVRPEGGTGFAMEAEEKRMRQVKFPPGWDEERVRRVLEQYEAQSDEEVMVEDEAAFEATTHTTMEVPVELVPMVRALIAKHRLA
jgi:hypothetical protein